MSIYLNQALDLSQGEEIKRNDNKVTINLGDRQPAVTLFTYYFLS